MTTRREGIALIAVVLALVVLEAAVAGALFLSTLEARTTRTLAARAHAYLAAESAIAAAIAGWEADTIAALGRGDTVSAGLGMAAGGTTMHARIQNIAVGTYLVTAAGTAPAPAAYAQANAAALVHWFAPAAFAAALPAALTVGGTATIRAGATVDGTAAPTACTSADSLARATFTAAAGIAAPHAGAITIVAGANVTGSPPLLIAPGTTHASAFALFGPIDTAQLAHAADRVETGVLALAAQPASSSSSSSSGAQRCDTAAAANWGAPANPSHPCANYTPLVSAPGDLTIASGVGQALLFVAGNLTIDTAAELHGIALVLGNATIRGSIQGGLRVRGDANIHGEVRRDPCAIWRALTRPRALARPHRRLPRWRLPAF